MPVGVPSCLAPPALPPCRVPPRPDWPVVCLGLGFDTLQEVGDDCPGDKKQYPLVQDSSLVLDSRGAPMTTTKAIMLVVGEQSPFRTLTRAKTNGPPVLFTALFVYQAMKRQKAKRMPTSVYGFLLTSTFMSAFCLLTVSCSISLASLSLSIFSSRFSFFFFNLPLDSSLSV